MDSTWDRVREIQRKPGIEECGEGYGVTEALTHSAKEAGRNAGSQVHACPSPSSPPYASQDPRGPPAVSQLWPALTHRNKARLDPWGRASCPTVPGLPSLHPEILM